MPARCSYDWAVIRVVPRVERGEFVNAGVVVQCRERGFLRARVELDEGRLAALAPGIDLSSVRRHLSVLEAVAEGGEAAGPIGQLPPTERFHWLVAPRSTIVQVSPVHAGLCDSPEEAMEQLMERQVRVAPVVRAGRQGDGAIG